MVLQPSNLQVAWGSPDDNEFFLALTQQSSQVIYEQALNEGLAVEGEDNILYGNYAISPGTSIEHIWGDNLGVLTEIRRQWDPKDVMSLTGGWKIPLSWPN